MVSSPQTAQIGGEAFLLSSLAGEEALSRLFSLRLELLAENERDIRLDGLIGRPASVNVAMADGSVRYFNGIVNRIAQGVRGKTYTSYRAELVPSLWLLTRTQRSRIFQQKSAPEILRQVLGSTASADLRLTGNYEARNYCVQYRETDFSFVSRLMEEEGIFYFFKHDQGSHTLVLADTPAGYDDVPGVRIQFDPTGTSRDAGQAIFAWEKTQELRSGRVTLWDHKFELPHSHLEGTALIRESVQVGQVAHRLRVANNDALEIYDYPGGYAERFDGVDKGGGSQPGELQKLFPEAARTAAIRMDEEALPSIVINGSSNSRQLAAGRRFTIVGHYNADGPYVLTSVRHSLRVIDPQGGARGLQYENSFTCIPESLTYRPPRTTPQPSVPGTQTAFVVGPAGEEIFTDKYGRVKVQFHWDREGQKDENSSCWIRVGQPWSSGTGISWTPEVGDEVIVGFEEGDPDRPVILGSVYNPLRMPPQPPQ